jgi:hypothetical protein
MSYGIKADYLDKAGRTHQAIIMNSLHDQESFLIISKNSDPQIIKIRINNLTQVSFDKTRGSFKASSKEYDHFITLFMLAESIDLIFYTRPDLESFLIFIYFIMMDEYEG